MSTLEQESSTSTAGGRLVVRLALVAVAALAAAGALMWHRFGPVIFVEMLTALQGCF